MRTIRFLLQKEFRQIFRNRAIVAMIMVMPVMQLILLPLAADYEVKNINLTIVDHDRSLSSQRMTAKIISSGYFKLIGFDDSYDNAMTSIENDEADLILEIPGDFERNLLRENHEELFISINAINGVKANLGGAYLAAIIRDFNSEIRADYNGINDNSPVSMVQVTSSNWFNSSMNYQLFMVPGILAILVTMVGGFLSSLNIVREKETGTIEQINVTPIRKSHFIIGKLVPFWVLGNVVFTLGLGVAYIFYGIVPQGNVSLLYLFISLYLLAVLGFGLLISTFCETQQQAMFIMFFFMMIFILMGGLFTSIDSMPDWAKAVAALNPVRYLIEVMRMVVLKGSDFHDVLGHLAIVALFAIVFNTMAVLNYRKTI